MTTQVEAQVANRSGSSPAPQTRKAAASARRSQADLVRTERQAETERRAGDAVVQRRDRETTRSLGSICSGC